ncbi:type II secretion system protein [Aquincola sp. MAHUQ-54]|uniref:Type II secretion system protein n=1 Tax=Aquincola agrisoli TaxID=3119538 RepID=A0AAW9QBT1_9BURK
MQRGEPGRATAPQGGFTLIALLVIVAVVGWGLAFVGPAWSSQAHREREQELLRIGRLYAEALQRYREMSPGGLKTGPARLEDLLLDTRFLGTVRHLRRLYPDPMGADRPWGLVRDAQGGIVGVFSRSEEETVAQGPVWVVDGLVLPPARKYVDWKFVMLPVTAGRL